MQSFVKMACSTVFNKCTFKLKGNATYLQRSRLVYTVCIYWLNSCHEIVFTLWCHIRCLLEFRAFGSFTLVGRLCVNFLKTAKFLLKVNLGFTEYFRFLLVSIAPFSLDRPQLFSSLPYLMHWPSALTAMSSLLLTGPEICLQNICPSSRILLK